MEQTLKLFIKLADQLNISTEQSRVLYSLAPLAGKNTELEGA